MELPYVAWFGWFAVVGHVGLGNWLLPNLFLLFAVSSSMSWFLAFETRPLLHKGVSFFDAHSIYVHGVWVSFFFLPIVEGRSGGCRRSGRCHL